MNIISHGMSSFYVVMVLSQIYGPIYEVSLPMLLVYFFVSFIPDIGGFWINELKNHHHHILHTPIIWILILIIGILFGYTKWAILIVSIIIFHLVTDFVTGRTAGVLIFYPFSKKEYSLEKTHPQNGNVNIKRIFRRNFWSYVKFYFSNKILISFEVTMIVIGLISLYIITK